MVLGYNKNSDSSFFLQNINSIFYDNSYSILRVYYKLPAFARREAKVEVGVTPDMEKTLNHACPKSLNMFWFSKILILSLD